MSSLAKYDAARYALSEAVRIDEVKDIRDKMQAVAAYARQAQDTEMVQWATEIKVRAERRAGQLLAETDKHPGSRNSADSGGHMMLPPKLDDIGISKNESASWQKLAAMPDVHFETAIETAKATAGSVTSAFMLREAKKDLPQKAQAAPPKSLYSKPDPVIFPDAKSSELDDLRSELAELKASMKETLVDNEMMGRVFDADDRIKAAMDEAKRQKAIAENAERTLAAKNGEYIERARAVTHWKSRAEKAEKELSKLKVAS